MAKKKIALLSAVVACSVAASASAEVKVTLGGDLDVQYGAVEQKDAFKWSSSSQKYRQNALVNSGNVAVKVDGGEEGSSLKYGGLMKFNANTSDAKGFSVPGDSSSNGVDKNILNQAMLYVETPFGKMEAGSTTGVGQAMQVGASSVAAGSSSDWVYYINPNTAYETTVRTRFLQSANLYTNEEGIVGTKTLSANKVNLYTPSYMGFRLGLTYIPDLAVRGTSSSAMAAGRFEDSQTAVSYKEIFQGGLQYENTFNDVNVKAAVLGETGKSKRNPIITSKQRKLQAYEAGLQVGYMGFALAGSYGSHGKSGALKSDLLKNSKYWTVGASYTYGPMLASLTYMDSRKGIAGVTDKTNKLTTTTFGVEYKLAEGFAPYASVTNFKMKQNTVANAVNNSGNVFLVGSKLNF